MRNRVRAPTPGRRISGRTMWRMWVAMALVPLGTRTLVEGNVVRRAAARIEGVQRGVAVEFRMMVLGGTMWRTVERRGWWGGWTRDYNLAWTRF